MDNIAIISRMVSYVIAGRQMVQLEGKAKELYKIVCKKFGFPPT